MHCLLKPEIEITYAGSPEAHIIPSALGGRLAPKGLLSHAANELLNKKVDGPLITQLAPLMTMLGARSDRGGPIRPTQVQGASSGKRYVIYFDKPTALAIPEYTETPQPDGTIQVEIKARDMREARTLLGRVRKLDPTFDVEGTLASATPRSELPDEWLRYSFNIGGGVIFPAAYTMLSLFAAHRLGFIPPAWPSYIEALDPAAPILPPDTFHFYTDAPWLIGSVGEVGHKLALSSKNGTLFGYVELFGVVCAGAVLSRDFRTEVNETYGCDVLARRDADDLSIDKAVLQKMTLAGTPPVLEQVRLEVTRRFDRFVPIALGRMRDASSVMKTGAG